MVVIEAMDLCMYEYTTNERKSWSHLRLPLYPCKGPSINYVGFSVCSALTESNEDAPVPNAPKVSFCPIK